MSHHHLLPPRVSTSRKLSQAWNQAPWNGRERPNHWAKCHPANIFILKCWKCQNLMWNCLAEQQQISGRPVCAGCSVCEVTRSAPLQKQKGHVLHAQFICTVLLGSAWHHAKWLSLTHKSLTTTLPARSHTQHYLKGEKKKRKTRSRERLSDLPKSHRQ